MVWNLASCIFSPTNVRFIRTCCTGNSLTARIHFLSLNPEVTPQAGQSRQTAHSRWGYVFMCVCVVFLWVSMWIFACVRLSASVSACEWLPQLQWNKHISVWWQALHVCIPNTHTHTDTHKHTQSQTVTGYVSGACSSSCHILYHSIHT